MRIKKNTCMYSSLCMAEGLHHAIQSSWPLLLLDCGWALEGKDVHLHQQGGVKDGRSW
jgi:hypothetical protein